MSARTGLAADASVHLARPAPELRPNAHSVHFYEEDSFLLDSLTKLVGMALVASDAAIVIATPEHRKELARRLKTRGLDLELAAQVGRYSAFDAAETLSGFMVNGAPDAKLFDSFMGHALSSAQLATEGESSRLVLFGEMVALLWTDGNFDGALKLERLWNDLAHTHSFHLHCAYPMKGFDREGHSQAFLNICAEHSHVVPTENYTGLDSENDRLRHISLLQQRALAAEAEAAGRLRAEEALRRSEKLAATGRLAASIAHEINNPLEAVSNAIYLARSSPSEAAEYLKIADEELARVAQITKQTLGFYRENASPGIVKISTLLDDLLAVFSGKLQAKDISITKQYRGELEIWGLEGELRQVFANQIANAIYAMPQHGSLTIRTRKSRCWSNGQYPGTVVSLVDTGSGISHEALPKIFDPFFTTKQDVGNGLGLWITQGIVTRHGGNIRVKSNTSPGTSGTIFTTFLPHHNGNTPAIPFD
jgi:signal transduction histidine kinase